MTFNDLDFNPHPVLHGVQAKTFFDNGYGASVIRATGTYGADQGLYELAVLNQDGSLNYDTHITNDVLGHLTSDDVTTILNQIEAL